MKLGYKILIAGVVIVGGGWAVWHFTKPKKVKDEPLPKPDTKAPEQKMSSSSGVTQEEDFVVENPKPTTKVQNVYSICSSNANKFIIDEKTKALSLNGLAYPIKGNTKIGEFIKNVFVNYNMPFVLVKDGSGNEVLVNKTHTIIKQE